jgi:hypothetical protein
VLLEIFSHLSISDWKSIQRLSKAWSVIAAKPAFDEIRVGPSDRVISSLRALSNHKYLREIPSRLRVEAKLVKPNLERTRILFNICSDRLGYARSAGAGHHPLRLSLPGSDAIMTHASRSLPLSSVDLAWREGELFAASAVRSRYTAYLDSVNQQQRWTVSRQKNLLGCALPKLPNIHHVIFTAT